MILSPAPQENLRYHQVQAWLLFNGFTGCEIRRLVAKGVFKQHFVPFGKRAWYSATQIRTALDGNREENTT